MSYQVLARKWRPSNFSQVAGQSHVLKSLINALDNQRLHHAYLFTGTRGVGKTTLARILAKCLNCEEGVSSTPCEKCDSCNEINQGRFIDLIEVDAASRTKVEDTRELLENVQYTPTRGRYKVYLIDEVHMLSNHSFNALLKTLEEPPPHVKFLFATTDPQKLPITILSRCLQFNLKNLSPELIVNYLQSVLESEEIGYAEEALWQIAAAAAGSMRDALTLVDQAIAYCQGDIHAEGVIEMLGVPEQRQVYELLALMAQRDAGKLLQLINKMAEQTPDYAYTLDSILSTLHRIALAQVVQEAIDNSYGDRQQVLQLASQFTAEDIQLYYQIGNKGRDELRLAADLRAAFEMLLLRMLLFSPDYAATTETGSDSSAAVAQSANEKKKPEQSLSPGIDAAPPEPAARQVKSTAMRREQSLSAAQQPASRPRDPLPSKPEPVQHGAGEQPTDNAPAESVTTDTERAGGSVSSADETAADAATIPTEADVERALSQQPQSPATAKPDTADEESEAPPADGNGATTISPVQALPTGAADEEPITLQTLTSENWVALYAQLKVTGIVANVLANTELLRIDGATIELLLDETQSAVYSEELAPRIAQVLGSHFDSAVDLSISVGAVSRETPARQGQRIRQENYQQMVDDFEQDQHVKELTQRFAGRVARESITPREE